MTKKTKAGDSVSVDSRAREQEQEVAAVWVDRSTLTPWKENPRKNQKAIAKVAASIKRFGFGSPILARAGGEVIAGHTRLLAAESLGLHRVPVRYLDLDPAEAHLLALADNKLGEIAEWDDALVASILSKYGLEDAALAGFDSKELDRLAAEFMPDEEGDSEPVEPSDELANKWNVARGDVWILEGDGQGHVLMCGDCREAADVSRLLGGALVNVAFTSPPYAAQREYDKESGFKPIKPDAYADWFEAVQANVRSNLAPDGSWFVNIRAHAEDGERHLYVHDLVIAHKRAWGWMFVDDLVWIRSGVPGSWPNRFKNGWEPVFHFAANKAIKFRPEAVGHRSDATFTTIVQTKGSTGSGFTAAQKGAVIAEGNGIALPRNVIDVTTEGDIGVDHPAIFPVGLPRWFINAYSDAGDVIYDPFGGSGTTLLAAAQSQRSGYAMELSPKYCSVAIERLVREGMKARKA